MKLCYLLLYVNLCQIAHTKLFRLSFAGTVTTYNIGSLWNGCVVCGTACILLRYAPSTADYDSIKMACKMVAEDYGYADHSTGSWNYRIAVGQTSNYINQCSLSLMLGKMATSTLLISQARTEIDNNRPCLLNISHYNSQHIDHAVVAFGWLVYKVTMSGLNDTFFYFYKIKDGDCSGDRYCCQDAITLSFVTKIN